MKCPHCQSTLLWSEDRGAHCDGCDEFTETSLEQQPAQPMKTEEATVTTYTTHGMKVGDVVQMGGGFWRFYRVSVVAVSDFRVTRLPFLPTCWRWTRKGFSRACGAVRTWRRRLRNTQG